MKAENVCAVCNVPMPSKGPGVSLSAQTPSYPHVLRMKLVLLWQHSGPLWPAPVQSSTPPLYSLLAPSPKPFCAVPDAPHAAWRTVTVA